MKTRICSNCKTEKNLDEFNKDKNKKGGVGHVCKDCNKKYMRAYYTNNKQYFLKDSFKRKTQNKNTNRQKMYEYLSNCSCTDCGNNDIRVLEFDHIGDKEFSVNQLLQEGRGWKRIMEEIQKCEVVCSNCHKIRTYDRSGSYRNKKGSQ